MKLENWLKPPKTKTVREIEIEILLKQALPYLIKVEFGPSTSPELRELIGKCQIAINGNW